MGVPDQKGLRRYGEYLLVRADEVGNKPRWWVSRTDDEYIQTVALPCLSGSGLHTRDNSACQFALIAASEAGRTPTPPSQDLKIGTSEKKPPLSLCPLGSLAGESRVRQYGNKKYADGNYLTADASKETVRRYISGVLRHLSVVQTNGVDALDEESGLPHLDHAIVGLRMLREIATKHGVIPEDPGEGNDPPRL